MPSYKLTYFDVKASRGESIRLAFHSGGIPFTDERLTMEQFGERKESCPFGQVPILTVDDKTVIPQEGAILRYIGRMTGAYSDDKEKALKQDVMIEFGDDLYSAASVFFAMDHAGKEMLKKNSIDERIPKMFGYLDKHLSNQGTTYSAGNDLSVADFKLYAALTLFKSGMLQGLSTDIVDNYTHVAKLYQAIEKHEKIASWKKSQAN
ncbi:hypothetical protein PTTG_06268 [Puccinia triticina 1-1 BBBD Race 1]|uniref:Glutathione S-transferase n=1 Tax=Puccinia triticina (isolate 1-1 / race 1 (BBBD)) TaxID=630390 RepID=A0A180GEE4_PUCT1|nr:hypothetical protein PTTG_06268 [Puccinia triticina 1-1 BBBD Race 1]WAR54414.1 hypothetical protein PtB15_4B31 [Puccinia triticina]